MENKKYILATDPKSKNKIFQSSKKNEVYSYASVYNDDFPNETLYMFYDGELIETFYITDID